MSECHFVFCVWLCCRSCRRLNQRVFCCGFSSQNRKTVKVFVTVFSATFCWKKTKLVWLLNDDTIKLMDK